MKPLFELDDLPLKDTTKIFNYEVFCRTLNIIDDKETLLEFLRIALDKRSDSDINQLFNSEKLYREILEITPSDNLEPLKELLRYYIRLDLHEKEKALWTG
jgi:hypothetical protein